MTNPNSINTPEITQTEKEIGVRFYESYEHLKELGLCRFKVDFLESLGFKTTSTSNFNDIKAGKKRPTIKQMYNLFLKYDVSPQWLFFGIGKFRNL